MARKQKDQTERIESLRQKFEEADRICNETFERYTKALRKSQETASELNVSRSTESRHVDDFAWVEVQLAKKALRKAQYERDNALMEYEESIPESRTLPGTHGSREHNKGDPCPGVAADCRRNTSGRGRGSYNNGPPPMKLTCASTRGKNGRGLSYKTTLLSAQARSVA